MHVRRKLEGLANQGLHGYPKTFELGNYVWVPENSRLLQPISRIDKLTA